MEQIDIPPGATPEEVREILRAEYKRICADADAEWRFVSSLEDETAQANAEMN